MPWRSPSRLRSEPSAAARQAPIAGGRLLTVVMLRGYYRPDAVSRLFICNRQQLNIQPAFDKINSANVSETCADRQLNSYCSVSTSKGLSKILRNAASQSILEGVDHRVEALARSTAMTI